MAILDVHEIRRILPHRYPFLLVDRIVELEDGKRAVGIKAVTIGEPFFTGHFPDFPAMPGVLAIHRGNVFLTRLEGEWCLRFQGEHV